MGSENEAKGNKRKKERKHKKPKKGNTELVLNDGTLNKNKGEYATSKPLEEKKRKRKKGINDGAEKAIHIGEEEDKSIKAAEEKNENKSRKKKRKGEKRVDDEIGKNEQCGAKAVYSLEEKNWLSLPDVGMEMRTDKSKGAKKKRKKDGDTMKKGDLFLKEKEDIDIDQDDVYHISSGDEDSSAGMKKWITEYHQSRPGLKVLQQRIDDFIIAHEERLEQERKEREAQAAEGGWTVVVHHKGRKKTTDSESGIAVGSVAQAAVEDKMTKKKKKEVVGLDFYRFKKREDRRNEILTLQSKFEEDKRRIQQMRAARKFRPY
ncbi:ABC transporter F family member 4-like isoform X2 [Tripterygium wilfordii]|uniref:ABC transporter F family member 4-like isoform X2 n=1 Tax=Tripterygium wilfordii TaxID=458696 RepID=UPI0018F81BAE|nr:ABC transporter F family member 4-like isoform X2 [Tripterygium wilfordii]